LIRRHTTRAGCQANGSPHPRQPGTTKSHSPLVDRAAVPRASGAGRGAPGVAQALAAAHQGAARGAVHSGSRHQLLDFGGHADEVALLLAALGEALGDDVDLLNRTLALGNQRGGEADDLVLLFLVVVWVEWCGLHEGGRESETR